MNAIPHWLQQAEAAKARGEEARSRAADDRAHWITKGVDEYGRGGRGRAAEELGISVGEVDKALARARGVTRPSGLPDAGELLGRLFGMELAEMSPPSEGQQAVLAHVVRGAFIDAAWLEAPGELLAQEVEDLDPDELADAADQQKLADLCRSWSRLQALAVIDAALRGAYR